MSRVKRAFYYLTIVGLLLGLVQPVFAGPPWPEPGEWPEYADGSSARVFDASLASQMEESAWKAHYEQVLAVDEAEVCTDGPVILDPDPGVGATQIIINRWSSGVSYEDDAESGTASLIWNIALTIVSYFVNTAGGIMLDVAQIVGDIVDQSKGAEVKLYHSFSYPDKLAQVWTSGRRWETYFTSSTREWYRHEWASYANTQGFTTTEVRNYTPLEGAASIHTNYAPHYQDDAWLHNEAYIRWYWGLGPGYEQGW